MIRSWEASSLHTKRAKIWELGLDGRISRKFHPFKLSSNLKLSHLLPSMCDSSSVTIDLLLPKVKTKSTISSCHETRVISSSQVHRIECYYDRLRCINFSCISLLEAFVIFKPMISYNLVTSSYVSNYTVISSSMLFEKLFYNNEINVYYVTSSSDSIVAYHIVSNRHVNYSCGYFDISPYSLSKFILEIKLDDGYVILSRCNGMLEIVPCNANKNCNIVGVDTLQLR